MNKRIIYALFTIAALVLGSVLSLNGQPVAAQDHSPGFSVFIESNHVKGFDWPLGVEITMEIDDPATLQDPDYSEVRYAHEVLGSSNEVHFGPEEAFAMQPGQSVSLTGGGYTKETIITYLAFGGVDMPGDRLWGYADPGAVATVKNWHDRDIVRWENADGSGYWEADFSVIGDQPGEERLHDFSLGTRFMISREDGDGDKTQLRDWIMPFPTMEVLLTQNAMSWRDWPSGYLVDIMFDDTSTPANPDYSLTVEPEKPHPSEPNCGCLPLGDDYRLRPGHTVTMTNGFLTKKQTVSVLQVMGVNSALDTISGTAEPNADVYLETQFFHWRSVQADASGNWVVDFSVPGDYDDEQATFDLIPWDEGIVRVSDGDNDSTEVTWPIELGMKVGDEINATNWYAGDEVTLTIDNPVTPSTVDFATSEFPMVGPWAYTGISFKIGQEFRTQPGHIVSLTQKDHSKTCTVSPIQITRVDYITDQVTGISDPNDLVQVSAPLGSGDEWARYRYTQADSSGHWGVDFSQPGTHIIRHSSEIEIVDIVPNQSISATVGDDNACFTSVWTKVAMPLFRVRLTAGEIYALNYLPAYPVMLNVYQPGDLVNPVYTDMQVMGAGNLIIFDYPDSLNIEAGYFVRTTDGAVTKEHTVTQVWMDDVNRDLDTVYGVAAAGTPVTVVARSTAMRAQRDLVAGSDGTWMADFSVPGAELWEQDTIDLDTAYITFAYQTDGDNDMTWVHWMLNQPPEVGAISGAADPAPVNSLIQVSASFSDPDPGDVHSAIWDWGDGTTSEGVVDEGSGTVSGSHIYSQAGVYTLNLTLCDAAGECDNADYQYVIVYDSAGGFVTGGGWIDSPVNENYIYMQVGGKATFGFVSKYKKGADVPEGNTEFQFKAGDLNFHSSHYKWLIVTGSNYAKFMGKGTINDEGINGDLYRFQIWASDNNPDTFRIKIWWEDAEGEHVIYDNRVDQAIGGGSIVIHTK